MKLALSPASSALVAALVLAMSAPAAQAASLDATYDVSLLGLSLGKASLAGGIEGGSYKLDWIEPLWHAWAAWCDGGDFTAPPDARIERFTPAAMRGAGPNGPSGAISAAKPSPESGVLSPSPPQRHCARRRASATRFCIPPDRLV